MVVYRACASVVRGYCREIMIVTVGVDAGRGGIRGLPPGPHPPCSHFDREEVRRSDATTLFLDPVFAACCVCWCPVRAVARGPEV